MALPDKLDSAFAIICPQWTVAATTISIGATTTRNNADLSVGAYLVTSDVTCHLRQGGSAVNATSSDAYVPSDVPHRLVVSGSDDARVAVIRHSVSGTLYLTPQRK